MNPAQKKIAKQARAGFLSLKLQGDVAGLTTYTSRRRRIVCYLQAPPKEPVTPDQAFFRSRFTFAIAAWRAMPKSQQLQWYQACKRANLRLGPTALIVAAAMPGQIATIRTIERQTATKLLDESDEIVITPL